MMHHFPAAKEWLIPSRYMSKMQAMFERIYYCDRQILFFFEYAAGILSINIKDVLFKQQ